MQKKLRSIIILLLALFGSAVQAEPLGTAFRYQGQLCENGNPVTGLYDFAFALYADQYTYIDAGGPPIFTNRIPVTNGVFTVILDFGPNAFDGNARYLEIAVQTNGWLGGNVGLGRQRLAPVPYALFASNAVNATTATKVVTGGVSAAQLNTPAGPAANQVLAYNGSTLVWTDPGTAATGWQLGGNSGTSPGVNFLGTTDNQPLEFKVHGQRGLRLEPVDSQWTWIGGIINVIEGSPYNTVVPGVQGATIGGGGERNFLSYGGSHTVGANFATISGGYWNFIDTGAVSSTIAGGGQNIIRTLAENATIGGGQSNVIDASSIYAFIGGGLQNHIQTENAYAFIGGGIQNRIETESDLATIVGGSGNSVAAYCPLGSISGGWDNHIRAASTSAASSYATIPGGAHNTAQGFCSFAAGYRAKALNAGTFVWADNEDEDFSSTAQGQFLIRASGGVGIGTTNPTEKLQVDNGNLYVHGPQNFAANTAATVFLGDGNNYIKAVWGQGLRLGVWQGIDALVVANGGNVGIGTTTPAAKLHVAGTTRTGILQITGGSDLAEPFEVSDLDRAPKGAVMVIDDQNPGQLRVSDQPYDKRVAGVVSGAGGLNPGLTLSQQGLTDKGVPVALSGRVYVLADASHGPIHPGDQLTSSDTPGHAMKVSDYQKAQGAIIGKAITNLPEGKGLVLVLVSLQ